MADNVVIELEGVNKWFGDFHVLKDIDLRIRERERVVVCGPSGSGKSTVIRCINRLEEHQEGRIVFNGQELDDDTGTSPRSGARWAWCSSSSISFPI